MKQLLKRILGVKVISVLEINLHYDLNLQLHSAAGNQLLLNQN